MVGRPRKYNTPEEMQEAIDAYFEECDEQENHVPLLGEIAYKLGFASRQSLYDYLQREEFSYIISRIKLKCENELNQAALQGKANPAIAKLNLATNYGYSDKNQVEHSGQTEIVYLDKQDEEL